MTVTVNQSYRVTDTPSRIQNDENIVKDISENKDIVQESEGNNEKQGRDGGESNDIFTVTDGTLPSGGNERRSRKS